MLVPTLLSRTVQLAGLRSFFFVHRLGCSLASRLISSIKQATASYSIIVVMQYFICHDAGVRRRAVPCELL
jgi:hypothetical protein